MKAEDFEGVVRAVNETLPKNRRFVLEVRRGGYASNAILYVGNLKRRVLRRVLNKWAGSDESQDDAVKTAVAGLAEAAVKKLGFPSASSYEEAQLKLAVARNREPEI